MKNMGVVVRVALGLLLIVATGSILSGQSMRKVYNEEKKSAFVFSNTLPSGILMKTDISGLPGIVQKYLEYSGSIGEDKIVTFTVAAVGEAKMTNRLSWVNYSSQQYNFLESVMKVFYFESDRMGVSQKGVLTYKDASATLFGKMSYVFNYPGSNSKELAISETSNFLIDMCLYAPGSLIDKRITWEEIDKRTVVAKFKFDDVQISLNLLFNEKGELIQLRTDDHYEHVGDRDVEKIPLSVFVQDYKNFGRLLLPSRVKIISHRSKDDYEFLRYDVIDVRYNINN